MAFWDWRGRAACLTHQSLSGLGVEGLLPDARVVFTNQLSNSLQPSTACQPGEMKTLLSADGEISDPKVLSIIKFGTMADEWMEKGI